MSEKNQFLYGLLKTSKEVFKLTKQRTSIGRNKNSQIVINNNTVSKDHAIIEFDEDYNATIKDLNSSNGTFVNGQKLKTVPLKLRNGDKIKFGKYEIEYIFESQNIINDTKTEPEINIELNQNNSIGINKQIYDSIELNNKNIKDGKISLVNENELSYPKINHFHNKLNNKTNGINIHSQRNKRQLLNNNLNIGLKQIYLQDNNNTLNNNKFFNNNENEEIENEINNNINNDSNNINNNLNNNIDNNLFMNSVYTFKNKMDELEKKLEIVEKEKEEINNNLNMKINELKKMTNLFDELNEEYSKLNSKHNALMIYASDIQKKLDLSNLQINEYKNKTLINDEKDFNKIINQKDNMINVLQNEINFYKELYDKNNKTFNQQMSHNINDNSNIILNNKLNTISDVFINENKKLKKELEIYKNKINIIKNNNNKKNDINFTEFETQINYQIDNFNNIISEYNSKLSDALNKINELFENNNKEEAAKYLVEQINEYMLENQKLISENAKLNTQIVQLQSLLNKEHENNILFNKNRNINSEIDIENKSNLNISNNLEINLLKNKVGQLESFVENIKNNNSNIENNNNNNLREAFVNILNELKTKENIVRELESQLEETIKRNNMNFDDKQIVNSISEKLKEKDNVIQNLKYKVKNENLENNVEINKKIMEIRKKRELFN